MSNPICISCFEPCVDYDKNKFIYLEIAPDSFICSECIKLGKKIAIKPKRRRS